MDSEKRKNRPIPKGRARKQDKASREVRPTDRPETDQPPVGLRPDLESLSRETQERERAEAALKRTEREYRNLFESAHDAILIFRPEDEVVLEVNQRACELYGFGRSEFIGMSLEKITKDVLRGKEHIETILDKRMLHQYESVHLRKDGSEMSVEINASVVNYQGRWAIQSIHRDVTERKRVEEALQFTRVSLDNATDTMVCVDREARYIDVNDTFCRRVGYSREELLTMTVHDIDPDYQAEIWTEFWERLKQAGSLSFESRHRTKDGRVFPVEIVATFFEHNGKEYHCSFARDITERKRIEEALRESEAKFRAIADYSVPGMGIAREGKIIYANRTMVEMFGYDADELKGMDMLNLAAPEDRRKIHERGEKRIRGEPVPNRYEFKGLRKDGRRIDVEVSSGPALSLGGAPCIIAIMQDNTERKRAEETLQESEAHYRLLAENVTDVIWTLDLNLRFTYISPSVRRLRGYSVEEAKGLSLKETLTPASFEKAIQTFSEEIALEGSGRGDPQRSRTLELENLCKDGSAIWTEVTTTFLRDPTGRPVEILGVTRDISGRRKVEEALLVSEAMSRAVIEHSPVGISIRDRQGVLLQVNEAWKKIWAISDAEIQENEKWSAGRSWKERCPYLGDSGQDVDRLFTPEGGVSILYLPEVEIPEPRPGAAQRISMYLYALRNQDGRVEKVVTLTQDITERKRSEAALRESEEKYRLVVDHASDAILVAQDGMMKFVNPRVHEITGYSEGELTSRPFPEFIHPEDRQMVVERHQKRVQGKPVPQAYPFRIVTKAGEDCWVEIRAVIIPWKGKPATLNFLTDITERRKAEEALRKNEAKYRELVENANSIILRRDPEGRITFFNEFAQRFFGFREEEILGRNVVGTIVPEKESSGRDLAQMIRDISRHPERFATNENENVLRNGERVWVAWTNKPILDPDGKLAEILCIGNDITERKRAEKALEASEVKYRTLVQGMSESLMQVDNDDRVQFVNPQFCQMIGYREGELLGRVGYEIYFDPEEQELIRRKNRLRLEKASDAYETRMRKKTGEEVLVRISGSPVTDGQGNVVGSIGVITDITERKRAEQAVKESETKYRGIVDHSLTGIYITQGHIMKFCNQRLAEIFGYGSPEELVGIYLRNLIAPESWETVDHEVKRRESGEVQEVHYEFKGQRKDGQIIDLEVLGGRILYEGKPAIQGSMIEVTERKLLEAEFLQAQKMEALGRLAGGVAHDFNNLLTSIMGYSDLLAKKLTEDDPSGPLCRYADNILSSANRAANLTQQLLSLSRRHAFHIQALDLNAVVAEVERILRGLIGEDIELTTHPEGALGRVKADSVQIEQVLMNLAINARDAMPSGGRLSIRTANVVLDKSYARRRREVAPGPYVMIAVTDTGHGMDAEVRSHLFEPFFTTKEKGKGTGLGLPTAYGIIKQSGGHIEVESAPGKGSTFKIYLPRTEESPAPLASPQPQPVEAELPRGVETVLLAEDEETVRSLAREVLRGCGYTVLEAGNGEEALRVAGSHPGPIHLLLTDVIMPRLGGPELARRLQPLRPDMRVLFMSGYTDGEISSYGGLGSETSLLQKPFQPIVLARRVREVLEAP